MKKNASLLDPGAAGVIGLQANTQFSEQGIVSRALITTPTMRVTLFGFAEGQELTEHASSSRAIIQILSGKSEWTIAGTHMEIGAGEVLHMPPGTRHAVRANEPFSMLLTLVKEAGAASDDE
jgi:quercetin dioxygenase-like cupin family protein